MTQIMTQGQPWPVYLTSLGFMLAYTVPAVPIVSARLGKMTEHPNAFAVFPLIILMGLSRLLKPFFPMESSPFPTRLARKKVGQFTIGSCSG